MRALATTQFPVIIIINIVQTPKLIETPKPVKEVLGKVKFNKWNQRSASCCTGYITNR